MRAQPEKDNKVIETTRWFQLTPNYNRDGSVKDFEVRAPTKSPPREVKGMSVKLTFKIPRALFAPMANVVLELDESNLDGTPTVIAADLKKMRDELDG